MKVEDLGAILRRLLCGYSPNRIARWTRYSRIILLFTTLTTLV